MNIADLLRPIPNFDDARVHRNGYREYPLDHQDPRNAEPLVDAADFGLAGQSYYSRPNGATHTPVPEVPPTILIRESIAEKLQHINQAVQASKEVTELLGGKVELYIDEGVRSQKVQALLYDEVFPRIIRQQNPIMTEEEVLELRNHRVAKPAHNEMSPSPHATGAAVDIKLRYVQPRKGFIADAFVDMGIAMSADMSHLVHPDYFEQPNLNLDARTTTAQRNRRLFYWLMKGALTGENGFAVNPMEWWHWSYGDQMWARSTRAATAFYGFPPEAK